jgi:hypothetical protein
MRRFTAVLFVFLAAVWLTPSTAGAQDGTPPPSPESPGPNLYGPMVVGLPFSDTFATSYGWIPTGAWEYVTDTAYENGGWTIDGFQRQFTSTLEYMTPIDLHGLLGAQLIYRQRGHVSTSDLIAVDISLDGGVSWFLVDQQAGLYADWEAHAVDLSRYRGQIILLRFRLSTGNYYEDHTPTLEPNAEGTPPAPIPDGYWIDNVTIQYVDKPTVARPPQLTLMGLHLLIGADRGAVLAFVRQMRDAGYPVGTVKGTSGTEDLLAAIKDISPETVTVYRSLYTPWGMRDCPKIEGTDPVAAAQEWMDGILPGLTGTRADYYEIMNECEPDPAWMVPFTVEAMRIATSRQVCLLVFSFATGMPDVEVYSQYWPVYQFALANPCQPGRYHGIALHAYGVNSQALVSESGDYLGLRYRLFYDQLLPIMPEAVNIPLYLTEAGPGSGSTMYPCDVVARDVIQYTQQLEADPYIKGFHLWNVGRGGLWVDFTPCLPAIGDALIAYYTQGIVPTPTPPPTP